MNLPEAVEKEQSCSTIPLYDLPCEKCLLSKTVNLPLEHNGEMMPRLKGTINGTACDWLRWIIDEVEKLK